MKKRTVPFLFVLIALCALCAAGIFLTHAAQESPAGCLTGAFIADDPTAEDIDGFKRDYVKKPYLIMVFVEWGTFVKPEFIKAVYDRKSAPFVTWEPWAFKDKQGIDFDKILAGGYDVYIREFADRLTYIKKDVYLRFAHEMNGDRYPWSAAKIGPEKYKAAYRHVKDIFDAAGAANVKWVFSVNWEDVPAANHYSLSYPGDRYVDYMGIDGYNWGTSRSGSRWMSFAEIFKNRYDEITRENAKPVIISEFGTSGSGGDKKLWIEEAMASIKSMKRVMAFVIFNVDKETDWRFPAF